MTRIFASLTLLLVFAANAWSQIFQCTNEQGKAVFKDKPCLDEKNETYVGTVGGTDAEFNDDGTLSEAQVTTIHKKITQGFLEGDLSFIDKYLYPGTKIFVDLDPSPSAGEKEVSMQEYRGMLEMGMQMMEDAEVDEQILKVTTDKDRNTVTIESKTIAQMTMMGIPMEDVSISTTVYGVVNNQIKVLEARDTIISTGPVE